LAEFAEVRLSLDDLEDLRLRVLNMDPGKPEDYPIQLFQLISRGPRHNRTPLQERKPLYEDDGSEGAEISYVRFYFDGLVSHVHLARGREISELYKSHCMGFTEDSPVFCHEYLDSRTNENIREMATTVLADRFTLKAPLNGTTSAVREAWPCSDLFALLGRRPYR
jgi:hypothetical protein